MTTPVRLPIVLFAALVLHLSVLPHFRVLGVAADAMILIAVAAGLVAGPRTGAVVGFAAGLLADLFLQETPLGLSALTYCLIGYAVGSLQTGVLRAGRWTPMVTAALACGLGMLLFAGVGVVVGQSDLFARPLPTTVLIVAVLGAVLSLLAVPAMRWAMPHARPRQLLP